LDDGEKFELDGDVYLLRSAVASLFLANLAILESGFEGFAFLFSGSMNLTVYTPSSISSTYSSKCEVLRLISER
jgi:hypothetical protein